MSLGEPPGSPRPPPLVRCAEDKALRAFPQTPSTGPPRGQGALAPSPRPPPLVRSADKALRVRYKGGVRLPAYAALILSTVALTSCGNDVAVELVWGGPPEPGAGGVVSVDGFASYQAGVDEHWERSAAMAAAEFVRLDERKAARTTIDGKASAEGAGPQTVVVTLDGLLDDSIRAERWTLGFEEEDGVYRLTAALREQRCQPGRGHQDFSADDCV